MATLPASGLRVAYVLHRQVWPADGVVRKIATQVRCWRSEVTVGLFAMAPEPFAPGSLGADAYIAGYRTLPGRVLAASRVAAAVRAWAPDAIYYRMSPPYPGLAALFRQFPTVVELNSRDLQEASVVSKPRYLYGLATHRLVIGAARGLVAVAREIAKDPAIRRYGKDVLVLGNGIDLGSVPELPAPCNSRPRLVCLASDAQPWQGVDKLVQLARLAPDLLIDVIGAGSSRQTAAWPLNIKRHPFLLPEQYFPMLAQADVAVAPLALHRKHMQETSPLKTREYLAAGLPTVTAYEDTDFPDPQPFLLRLPNTETNVLDHAETIRDFAYRMQGVRVPRSLVAPHIDATKKEAARLAFMCECTRSANSGRPAV